MALVGTLVAALLWWRGAPPIDWVATSGRVGNCTIESVHYNAPDQMRRVTMDYTYRVGGAVYEGAWSGIWPEILSPNALPSTRVDELREPNHKLVVYYDRSNPYRSRLHDEPSPSRVYGWAVAGAGTATLIYCAMVYPRWKKRRVVQRLSYG